jgi:hypothetical protein
LIPPAVFYIWYQRYEFYRLSPDIASVGLAITPFDALSGVLLAVVAITAGAYRLGSQPSPTARISDDLRSELDRRSFHESFFGLALLAIDTGYSLFYMVRFFMGYSNIATGTRSVSDYVSFLCSPTMQLQIAMIVAASQWLWTRWKMRNQAVAWTLLGLSPQLFMEGWSMLALLLVVGIPTARAFAFLLWFGPYHLLPLFGL